MQWSVGMVMEEAALADRRSAKTDCMTEARRKPLPAAAVEMGAWLSSSSVNCPERGLDRL